MLCCNFTFCIKANGAAFALFLSNCVANAEKKNLIFEKRQERARTTERIVDGKWGRKSTGSVRTQIKKCIEKKSKK